LLGTQKKGVRDSARLDNGPGTFEFDGKRVRLPVIGWVKLREGLRFSGKALSTTLESMKPDVPDGSSSSKRSRPVLTIRECLAQRPSRHGGLEAVFEAGIEPENPHKLRGLGCVSLPGIGRAYPIRLPDS